MREQAIGNVNKAQMKERFAVIFEKHVGDYEALNYTETVACLNEAGIGMSPGFFIGLDVFVFQCTQKVLALCLETICGVSENKFATTSCLGACS